MASILKQQVQEGQSLKFLLILNGMLEEYNINRMLLSK